MPNVATRTIVYTKRTRKEYDKLRAEFDNTERKNFCKSLVKDPIKKAKLKKAGLNQKDFNKLQQGKVPKGYQIHHKLPLDDGGSNDVSNLVLIKNDPHHIALTNAQSELVRDMSVGESRTLKYPVPQGFIYPP